MILTSSHETSLITQRSNRREETSAAFKPLTEGGEIHQRLGCLPGLGILRGGSRQEEIQSKMKICSFRMKLFLSQTEMCLAKTLLKMDKTS